MNRSTHRSLHCQRTRSSIMFMITKVSTVGEEMLYNPHLRKDEGR
ncbi:hypothetical protein HanHA300_Chr10g0372741 [Helianthus annuus]|nr:hypothetical protein HanHA300_Chr10g0372741 [Helianthus annuus]KAJ0530869.1 hypothetical protein HanHA89_Chr10g0394871 [Helianthus annuus]KAJ0701093.1 hypothetical protein HanOQP8_Chr10g0375631 [Helianthus annuus]